MSLISDTNQESEKVQIACIQNMSVAKRLANMKSLTELTMRLSRRAILRRNPDFTKRDVDLTFVALHYGDDLAERLKQSARAESGV